MHREEYTRVLCRYGHDEGAVQECDEECLHGMTPARPVVMVTPAMLLNSGRSYNSKCPPGTSRPPGTSHDYNQIKLTCHLWLPEGGGHGQVVQLRANGPLDAVPRGASTSADPPKSDIRCTNR